MQKILSKNSNYSESGFTLVELMIVVAIIGILSSIAVPNFRKYQAKSKTSEAKIQLAAAYTGLVSFHADFSTYHSCLRYMGYNPENEAAQRFYAVGFQGINTTAGDNLDQIAEDNGAIIDGGGCLSGTAGSPIDGEDFFIAGKAVGTAAIINTDALFNANQAALATSVGQDDFEVAAVGVIDKNFDAGDEASGFTMDHNKMLRNYVPGY